VGSLLRLVNDLSIGQANDFVAEFPQFEIAGAIIFERFLPSVISVAICLHDQPSLSP